MKFHLLRDYYKDIASAARGTSSVHIEVPSRMVASKKLRSTCLLHKISIKYQQYQNQYYGVYIVLDVLKFEYNIHNISIGDS